MLVLPYSRFCLINAGVLYLYFSNYLQIDEEEYGGTWELTKEGFMTSFALFMVCVTDSFTASVIISFYSKYWATQGEPTDWATLSFGYHFSKGSWGWRACLLLSTLSQQIWCDILYSFPVLCKFRACCQLLYLILNSGCILETTGKHLKIFMAVFIIVRKYSHQLMNG